MTMDSNDRSILAARVKVGRVGASRLGYCPDFVDTKTAGAAGAKRFYVHHETVDDTQTYPTHTTVAE